MKKDATYWIEKLNLNKHPEGGYFKETYRSTQKLSISSDTERNASTAIYFLLSSDDFSAFHRLSSDEIWHFYEGNAVDIFIISPEGILQTTRVGQNLEKGEVFQAVIPAHHWFAAQVVNEGYVLVGCTVAPGFEFEDFELAERAKLIQLFPQHEKLIAKHTID